MKKVLFIAALLASSMAMAGNDNANPCGNNGNNCGGSVGNVTATNGPINNTNNNNVAGGTGVGIGIAAVNNDISVKPVINTNISNDVRNNAAAAIIGSGNSTSTSKVGDVKATVGDTKADAKVGDITIDASNNYKRAPVASALAYAPAPTATCSTSNALALQAVGVGFSWSGSDAEDDGKRQDCWELEDIRAAFNYGDAEVAEEMLMGRKRYAAAKQRIADRKAAQAVGK